jgi:hypothetical protein
MPGRGYGELPAQEASAIPSEEFAVDLPGPWKIVVNGFTLVFSALTCDIDPVMNIVELIWLNNKTAAYVAHCFQDCW